MRSYYRSFIRSRHPLARMGKRAYRGALAFTLPAPRVLLLPLLWIYLAGRGVYHTLMRLLVCEPLFKAYCKQHGRSVRTDSHIHWITGPGDIIVGDDVLVDGKCSIGFAARFSAHPTLTIGSRTGIGHGCAFTIGKSITIGDDCRVAGWVWMFDSNGHPADPSSRLAGRPPADDDVRPIVVENNVWIGERAIVHPGVRIGEGSIVSAGSVVMSDVPAFTVVAGNPARKIASLQPYVGLETVAGPERQAGRNTGAERSGEGQR